MARENDPFTDSVWLRPGRPRRGRPQLSREEIVGAAVALLDAEGLDGFSMRRLGASISAGATSMYFYVANKDELLELVVDEVLGEVEVPDAAEAGWREAAAGLARGFRTVLLRHPWVVQLFGTHPALGPNGMRISDRTIALLAAAGLSGAEIGWASSLLVSHAIGYATSDAALNRATRDAGKSPDELVEQLRPFVERVAGDYPAYAEYWRRNMPLHLDPDAGFEFGLERILDGLHAWLDRRS
ncbi:TetR/AcrR family transcriptional regulator C-terminal domain-containing protein [Actinomadura montaniterrae]|uniref:TetR/AcrR family transcriptional regulator n=1 Tax=Actinomadura montaniterrae TaxID=1803903 RepID=A0A6L3VMF8_9ACTN|nr:TetR/AcrR family transcriptional regulator C-terminal domain-containing protein [Actinomadura montaniterrae]KAB2362887.1 TetR/AcrR family transcriptional regulator [Actinomadura montaniterrae]